jgi:uncharacterized membrane protein YjfL (UPF0719 family)
MGGVLADASVVVAGLVAYAVAVLAATVLVFLTYRLNMLLSRREAEDLLRSGHRSTAIALGAVLLSQSILLRHAVFPTMAVVRDLFLAPAPVARVLAVVGQCALFFVIIGVLSVASVVMAEWLFTKLTGRIAEQEEIRKDNLAVAIFFAFAVLAITVIVNEGMEDLSRSLIPYGATRVLEVP